MMYQGHSVIPTTDGGYCIGGVSWYPMGPVNYSYDPIVIKTDSAGNQQWMKTFGGWWADDRAMVCNTKDGNIIVGTAYCDSMQGGGSHPSRRINIIKLDNAGNILWDRKYGESAGEREVINIRENNDGSLVTCGTTVRFLPYSYQMLGFIFKTTAEGDSVWYREYLNSNGDYSKNYLFDVIETPDKGYLACGMVYPTEPDTGKQDGWILKVDSLGCESVSYCWVGQEEITVAPEDQEVLVYPNPASTVVTLRYSGKRKQNGKSYTITLYDLFGREVRRIDVPAGQTETTLDLRTLPDGQYLVRITDGNGFAGATKVIKLAR